MVLKFNGEYILKSDLCDLTKSKEYTDREIRPAHNILRLLLSGHLNWKKNQ
jgi:hypothetical protein